MTATLASLGKSTARDVADDPRWARIVARDKTADGHFWYSVVTTGVYCRPSCPSRTANPRNVQLHDTLKSARATGFRPCKRCKPDGASLDADNAALVALTTGGQTATAYDVMSAAVLIGALPPLLIYFFGGRYFIRGLTQGAIK